MKRQQQFGAFVFTFVSAAQTFAQTAASVPVPAASKASEPPVVDGAPGGNVTWFVVGLAVGFAVGYMVGKNSKKTAAAT